MKTDASIDLSDLICSPPAFVAYIRSTDTSSAAGRGSRLQMVSAFVSARTITALTREGRLGTGSGLNCVVHAPLAGLSCKFSEHGTAAADNTAGGRTAGAGTAL